MIVVTAAPASARTAATRSRTVSTGHAAGQLPFWPTLAPFGTSRSSRSCSYSSGAASRASCHSPNATTTARSLSSGASQCGPSSRSAATSVSIGASRPASGAGSACGSMRSATRSQLALHDSASVRSWSRPTPAIRPSSSGRSIAGSSTIRSTKRVQRSSNANCDSMSSSTSTRGGRPASMGCSPRMRCANEWRVTTAAPSSSSSAVAARLAAGWTPDAARRSSSRRIRSRSSAAAFSVKVTAAISRIGTSPTVTNAHTRSTSDFVLPEPAPASTNSVAWRSCSIAWRASWSWSTGSSEKVC